MILKNFTNLFIVIVSMVKIVVLNVAFAYNSQFDVLGIIESFPSSPVLDILPIANSLSPKI